MQRISHFYVSQSYSLWLHCNRSYYNRSCSAYMSSAYWQPWGNFKVVL